MTLLTGNREGALYQETRHLSPKEISARIRADIREAVNTGQIPKEWKYSVRLHRFAGGYAIDVEIIVPKWVIDLRRQFPYIMEHPKYRSELVGEYAPLALLVDTQRIIEEIHESYNYYESYFPADGCGRRYFGQVSVTWKENK